MANTRAGILKTLRSKNVSFMRLQFTDILGANKNVEVPKAQFEKALDGEIMFDGSSIAGFSRIEESDMLLAPDYSSFAIFPWSDERGSVARLICDVKNPEGGDFDGCPRLTLKRAVGHAKKLGYSLQVGPEAEFFLFQRGPDGSPTTDTHDAGGYFDLAPVDRGEDCRREIVNALTSMGFEVEAAHHEVAPGQHEIDFRYGDAVQTADNVSTFRFVVRKIALHYDLHATFMPKPLHGVNGSGMHCHQSLFKGTKNAFFDKNANSQLSKICLQYVAGVLSHARAISAVTNPLVNSYKRLVPGFEAPTNITWSERNRSPLARIPARREVGTRVEIRSPDPSCNPYLAFAVMLEAGLDGVENHMEPTPPVNKNIFAMSEREKKRLKIGQLPATLGEAIDALEKDKVVLAALGSHIATQFIRAKRQEWRDYESQVHQWETDRYLRTY